MYKLKINLEGFLADIKLFHGPTKDMNEDSEAGGITDPKERKMKADGWIKSRLTQLDHNERDDKFQLKQATRAGYIKDLWEAERQVHEVYDELREQSRTKYLDVMAAQPTASS